MAIIFELWVEGHHQSDNERLALHFHNIEMALMSRTIRWTAELINGSGVRGVIVSSPDLSRFGVRTVQDAVETTEAGLKLYHRLLSAPDFRFARVGWEAEILSAIDVPDYVEVRSMGDRSLSLKCVVNEAFFEQLGKPTGLRPFREGYLWKPYWGEEYRPLFSQDQTELNAICRGLFPDFIHY